ncbi:MAG: LuxR C-terminal-related transcriptional regulator [Tannerella sp.]|jgi:DNA-binding NarL/FixJ family response regulator|nr:LuxR C-terminal-related transcriptional regulator [Tannerella sp.]
MSNVRLQIAIAEPSVIVRNGIIAVLKRFPSLNVNLFEIADPSRLTIELCKWKPDILIVNPLFPYGLSVQGLKNETGCRHMKCIAMQHALMEPSILKIYDETISIYDTSEQVREKLESLCCPDSEPAEPVRQELSVREKEIIVCVVKGMTNKQIAEHLCLSAHTVITHRRNIANKLQIHSPAGLTIYAIVNKLVELNEVTGA